MSTTTTVVVALIGGVGGAALTGLIQVFASAAADRRRSQHELDAWLRDRRFEYVNRLVEFVATPPEIEDDDVRAEYMTQLHNLTVPLRTVLPRSLDSKLNDFVKLVNEEMRKRPSAKVSFFLGFFASDLQSAFQEGLGWDQEPIRKGDKARRIEIRLRKRRSQPPSD